MSDRNADRVVVVGLGRFGGSLAVELMAKGVEVLGVDVDPKIVQRYADDLTHVVVADTTDAEAMRQIGVDEHPRAVVGIGSDLEASILTTAVLVDFAIPGIWAKAISREHGRILERIGAHHVVLPEHEMGERVAHLVTGRMLDYVELEDDYAMIKTRAPRELVGRRLGEGDLRSGHGVTLVGIKRPGGDFAHATAETALGRDDVLIVAGRTGEVERFADLP